MSGISTTTGLISGLNTSQIISQLLAIEARPKAILQTRIADLQRQQAAVLDLNGRLSALKTAAAKFNTNNTFRATSATSTNADVLRATSSAGAALGTYSFTVDRTVSTQQLLSRAYADRNVSSVGLTSLTVEPPRARLDADTELAQINGGQGLSRGKIIVTDRAGTSATIDLSRVSTVSEVLEAINNNGTANVRASVSGGQFVITDGTGSGGALSVRSVSGYTTAESLGLAQSVSAASITGSSVYSIGDNTTLASLRDSSGIRFNTAGGSGSADLVITTRDGTVSNVDISDLFNATTGVKTAGAVATVAQLRQRIAEQTGNRVALSVRSDGRGFELVDSSAGSGNFSVANFGTGSAATDLGIVGDVAGTTISGETVLAGLNTTLATSLNAGVGPRDGTLTITRDSTTFNLNIDTSGSISDIFAAISSGTSGRFQAALSQDGRSVVLTDTVGGTGNLIVSGGLAGAGGLNIETDVGGVAGNTVNGSRVARQYVRTSTALTAVTGGTGVGTGSFDIIGANGVRATVNVGSEARTVGDIIDAINAKTGETGVIARINDSGSGIVVEEQVPGAGGALISITDTTGTVARSLNLAGASTQAGVENRIDGTFRRTISLDAGDSLDAIVTKINAARAGVSATIVSDGSGATPFRLQLASSRTGAEGRFLVETAGADLGFTSISRGENARVFFGSADPARALLINRPTNSIDGVIDGVRIDAVASSANPVSISIASDASAIETAVQEFVTAYNALQTRIGQLTDFNQETNVRGPLLGDGTSNSLARELASTVNGPSLNVTGQFRFLSQVGVRIGAGGQLTLDTTKLRTAITADPQGVADLFAAKVAADRPTTRPVIDGVPGITTPNTDAPVFTSLGVAERMVRLTERYLDSVTGTLTGKSRTIDEQIRRSNDRITDIDRRLASKQTTLERQFASLEETLSRLQAQQSSLASIASLVNQ